MTYAFHSIRLSVGALAMALVLQLGLSGCAQGGMGDALPQSMGGLPAAAPPRPAQPHQYPAVHDMPPERASTPLNEREQYDLEKELQAIRDRQGALAADPDAPPPAAKQPAAAAKKKPVAPKSPQTSGAKTNP